MKNQIKYICWLTNIKQCVFGLDFPYNLSDKIKEAMKFMRECLSELDSGKDAEEKAFVEI